MSKWPAYRKGAQAMIGARALPRAIGAGFQMPTVGGLLGAARNAPWYPKVGGALALFRLAAPGVVLGVGLAGMKFINWWQTRPEGIAGYSLEYRCNPGRGVFKQNGFGPTSCNLKINVTPGQYDVTNRPITLYEWQYTGNSGWPTAAHRELSTLTVWKRTVAAGPLPNDPAIRLPPIYFPTNVLAKDVAGVGPRPIAPPISTPIGVPALPEASSGSQPGLAEQYPVTRPMTGKYSWSPKGLNYSTVPTVRAVPDVLTHEQKMRMAPGLAALVLSFNATTEYADVVKALFDGLKDGPCKAGAGVKPSTAVMAQAVIECRSQMVWAQAMYNLAWANVEDMVWAKLGLPTKEAGLLYGTNAPVNIALSKAMGDDLAAAFKKVGGTGTEGVAFVQEVTRKVLDTIINSGKPSKGFPGLPPGQNPLT